jgi:NADPH-dependent curcumin reductase CurA
MTHLQVERYPEARQQLLSWISQGQLKSVAEEYEGVENCGVAFANLFAGVNFGKSVVRVR